MLSDLEATAESDFLQTLESKAINYGSEERSERRSEERSKEKSKDRERAIINFGRKWILMFAKIYRQGNDRTDRDVNSSLWAPAHDGFVRKIFQRRTVISFRGQEIDRCAVYTEPVSVLW